MNNKPRETYEIMKAEDIGLVSTFVLGKHSGRNAQAKINRFKHNAKTNAELDGLFYRFKDLADKKHDGDEDLTIYPQI